MDVLGESDIPDISQTNGPDEYPYLRRMLDDYGTSCSPSLFRVFLALSPPP